MVLSIVDANESDKGSVDMSMSYKKLDVYKAATEYLAVSITVAGEGPRGNGPLVDQLRRASMSIPLNIAEGSGKKSRSDGARFFSIARGSAMECGAIMDAISIMALGAQEKIDKANQLLERIVAMLTKLCH